MTVHTLKQCRPDQEETEYFWKLFHAAQRNDARWHGSEISIIADELSRTDLDRNQKLFLLRSWQVLVDDKGGFGRFMGAFDTYVYNMQDPDDDCVAWKPELSNLLCDGQLLDVVIDAYQSARQRIAEQSAIVAAAEKLVRCKGRYHSELNYRALAKLFGVVTPDLPPLEHENVHYADAAEVEITALRQRIQELEAKLETADKLQDSAFRDGLKAGFSYGQTDDQSGFTQCMSAYSTHAGIKREGE
ncbi:hypothetical protein CHD23_13610 [Salmonella enterica]|nr:hypothetical protein CHD23_13610 [Salmonella enterica]